jgi:hypothetical protein
VITFTPAINLKLGDEFSTDGFKVTDLVAVLNENDEPMIQITAMKGDCTKEKVCHPLEMLPIYNVGAGD